VTLVLEASRRKSYQLSAMLVAFPIFPTSNALHLISSSVSGKSTEKQFPDCRPFASHRNLFRPLPGPRTALLFLLDACLSLKIDIWIRAEQIGGIVFPFEGGQAWQVGTKCSLDNVLCFDVKCRK
jgi:hypothetical protein